LALPPDSEDRAFRLAGDLVGDGRGEPSGDVLSGTHSEDDQVRLFLAGKPHDLLAWISEAHMERGLAPSHTAQRHALAHAGNHELADDIEAANREIPLVLDDVPTILEHAASGEVDLVLLDVSLTNSEWDGRAINGIELCRMVKEKSPRHLPVLLATAHAVSGDRERFLETSGADGYLEKPVYASAILVEKVRSLINSA